MRKDKKTVTQQVKMLRRHCLWQQSQGTGQDNGYPYSKHLPDCDICRSAEMIERLALELETSELVNNLATKTLKSIVEDCWAKYIIIGTARDTLNTIKSLHQPQEEI